MESHGYSGFEETRYIEREKKMNILQEYNVSKQVKAQLKMGAHPRKDFEKVWWDDIHLVHFNLLPFNDICCPQFENLNISS